MATGEDNILQDVANDGSLDMTTDGSNTDTIRAVQIKLPPFWKANPQLWFMQIECQFLTNSIRADASKYNHLVGKLDTDILDKVSDIVLSPLATGKYTTLKNRLIKEFSDSERKKLRCLFSEDSCTSSKPSDLLRKMKDKSCGKVTDDLLKELWFNRLPKTIQSILSCSTEPLSQLSTMADKIYETMDSDSIQAVTTQHQVGDGDLAKKICKLEDKIDSLQQVINKSNTRIRSSSRNRLNSRSPSRDTPNSNKTCWHHHNFGKQAQKCVSPCSFQNNTRNNTYASKRSSKN